VFGLRYDYHFSPRWSAGAQGAVFALKYNNDPVNAEGSLFTGRLYLEYRFARNFALAAALESFAIETQVSQSEWRGGLDYRYIGPQIYATARF
jgi:hypothetical protein